MTGHPTPDGPPCAHGGDAETVDASVRDMLLLTASALAPDPECGDVDAGLVLGAGRRLGLTPSVLAAAEADGLVRWSGGRVGFTCGRLRAAVYDRAPAARRRAAHAALALASAREGRRLVRLVHVALSVRGPAPRLAAELATEAAREDAGRSHRERASAYLRAAELTAGSGARAERWTAAAEQARLAGASGRAAGLLAVARREGGHASVRGRAELVRG
ncbi:hypothetical protein [Streptomyces sp. CC210A]|uniref:hypothetical protein n=1 Tax=Streptomyces sp. CC210A TaxID=2898184 RepID=UPI001F3406C8|nr:hypothetical protein [Streptomyces sp. CC210A]